MRGRPADGWRACAVIGRPAKSRSLTSLQVVEITSRGGPGLEPQPSVWTGKHYYLLQTRRIDEGREQACKEGAPAPSIRAANKAGADGIRNRAMTSIQRCEPGLRFGASRRMGRCRNGFPGGLRCAGLNASRGHAGTKLQRSNFSGGSARWQSSGER